MKIVFIISVFTIFCLAAFIAYKYYQMNKNSLSQTPVMVNGVKDCGCGQNSMSRSNSTLNFTSNEQSALGLFRG